MNAWFRRVLIVSSLALVCVGRASPSPAPVVAIAQSVNNLTNADADSVAAALVTVTNLIPTGDTSEALIWASKRAGKTVAALVIPEPSTYVAVIGAASLLVTMVVRRKRAS